MLPTLLLPRPDWNWEWAPKFKIFPNVFQNWRVTLKWVPNMFPNRVANGKICGKQIGPTLHLRSECGIKTWGPTLLCDRAFETYSGPTINSNRFWEVNRGALFEWVVEPISNLSHFVDSVDFGVFKNCLLNWNSWFDVDGLRIGLPS